VKGFGESEVLGFPPIPQKDAEWMGHDALFLWWTKIETSMEHSASKFRKWVLRRVGGGSHVLQRMWPDFIARAGRLPEMRSSVFSAISTGAWLGA
jgi:hypothetical protein